MPVYDYKCKACGADFEVRCGIRDSRKNVRCAECSSRKVSQLLGSFTALGLTSKRPSKRGDSDACGSCAKSSCVGCSH